jgi:hypothetical protein
LLEANYHPVTNNFLLSASCYRLVMAGWVKPLIFHGWLDGMAYAYKAGRAMGANQYKEQ